MFVHINNNDLELKKDENYYPSVFLEECQCKIKEQKINKITTSDTETSSEDDGSESDF